LASQGIGAGLVEAFLKEGYNVATSCDVSQSLTGSPSLVLVDGDIGKQEIAAKAVEAAIMHFETYSLAGASAWASACSCP
jgi:NAD(P)-dependent dehydrogenase (short-subunit alcohol dehydrogenase family)